MNEDESEHDEIVQEQCVDQIVFRVPSVDVSTERKDEDQLGETVRGAEKADDDPRCYEHIRVECERDEDRGARYPPGQLCRQREKLEVPEECEQRLRPFATFLIYRRIGYSAEQYG